MIVCDRQELAASRRRCWLRRCLSGFWFKVMVAYSSSVNFYWTQSNLVLQRHVCLKTNTWRGDVLRQNSNRRATQASAWRVMFIVVHLLFYQIEFSTESDDKRWMPAEHTHDIKYCFTEVSADTHCWLFDVAFWKWTNYSRFIDSANTLAAATATAVLYVQRQLHQAWDLNKMEWP